MQIPIVSVIIYRLQKLSIWTCQIFAVLYRVSDAEEENFCKRNFFVPSQVKSSPVTNRSIPYLHQTSPVLRRSPLEVIQSHGII